MAERIEGWGNVDGARDAHYFRKDISLCGRWMAFGSPRWETNQVLGTEPTKGTCKTCWNKRAREEQRANATADRRAT